jgi:hypothetical protein
MTIYFRAEHAGLGIPADVRNDRLWGRMNCGYCNTTNVQALSLYENIRGPSSMPICPNCGAGLGPSRSVPAYMLQEP